MLDGRIRPLIDPPLNRAGRMIARAGIGADEVTLAGFVTGITGAGAIVAGQMGAALALIVISRILDGLDGAVARATIKTDRGGFLDIVLDFIFYGSVPLAFALADPFRNALPAALLLASFYFNGAAFLAHAIMAERRGQQTTAQGQKSLFYLAGLAEGFETIAVFVVFCLWPASFPWLAAGFAAVCAVSAAARIILSWKLLG